MQSHDTDRDVLQPTVVEVAAELVRLDGRGQPVERTVRVDLAGLRVDREDDVAVAVRELFGGSDQPRLFGSRLFGTGSPPRQ